MIQCKMCGGSVILTPDRTIGVCEYCGSTNTYGKISDEQRAAAFNRGNDFRRAGEFDNALAAYEQILREDDTDAEAHWCAALCRFGIDYVRDPDTLEWFPTCHRASFNSFLEDVDYLAALEHSDGITRLQYRKDATKIAEVQKGILATSQNEEPYDVFICFKDKGEDGQRTPDSILAQEIYYQLTERGHRVFFSRITLEGKGGAEYEPYIFAALNSAKVMVAVGTSPEHFNSVWVKNEWSRFLALMRKDRNKMLLPCYRDMDPYYLPEQLKILQSYDMAKIGFLQDLIHGVDKVVRAEKKPAVTETVVVQQNAATNVTALVKRGNMALEDGEWEKADDFFEQALNQDAELAEAYLGKALAQETCKSINALISKRRALHQNVRGENLQMEPNKAHVEAMVQKYAINGYVEQSRIRGLYDFDMSYHSDVAERKQQYQNEETFWANHKLLSRAEKFAAGTAADNLKREKQALFATLSDKVTQAETEEIAAKKNAQARYEAHLRQADAQAEDMYRDGYSRRDMLYQELLKIAKASTDIVKLRKTAQRFMQLEDYRDSRMLVEYCHKRAVEEQRKIDAEKERQRVLAEQKMQQQQQRNRKITAVVAVAACAVIAFLLFWSMVIVPKNRYNDAVKLMNEGKLVQAAAAFGQLGDYQDAREKSLELWRQSVESWRQNGTPMSIAVGQRHTLGLEEDGSVVAVGWNGSGRCDVSHWTGIVAISAGEGHSIGLKADGTVEAAGWNEQGQGNVSNWVNIVAVSAGEYHTVGLKADGTVTAVGWNKAGQCDVSNWTDIIAISSSKYHTVGLKADGTVVATGSNEEGQCDVSQWEDIVAVSAGECHTVGLKADGTAVIAGSNYYGGDVSQWTDIVAVDAGKSHTVGLKADGTVVAAGRNRDGQCDVSQWTDIVAISAGDSHTVGLKADGTVVAVGANNYGQCNVSDWKDIMIP